MDVRLPARRRLVVIVVVGLLVIAGAIVAVRLLAGAADNSTSASAIPPTPGVKTELLEKGTLDASCPDDPGSDPPAEGEAAIDILRLVDGCLQVSAQNVKVDEADATIKELEQESDVVAADRRGTYSTQEQPDTGPPLTGPEAVPALQLLDVNKVRALWPENAPEIRVAVIDTGVSFTEPRLQGKVVARVDPWVPPAAPLGGHGTTVASIIAADGESDSVAGLTPNARILDAQLFATNKDSEERGVGSVAERASWAIKQGAKVLNMSFGWTRSRVDLAVLLKAESEGVVSVASVGNCHKKTSTVCPDNTDQVIYPAGYDAGSSTGFMISVGSIAVSADDGSVESTLSDFSSRNSSLDVVAPGEGLTVNCLRWVEYPGDLKNSICSGDDTEEGSKRSLANGTSFAVPYVSATAALLLARHPDATPSEVRNAIYKSATCDDECAAYPEGWGHGILNPAGAAAELDILMGSTPATGSSDPEDRPSNTQSPSPTETVSPSTSSSSESAAAAVTFEYAVKEYTGPISGNGDKALEPEEVGPPSSVSIFLIYSELGTDYSGDLYLSRDLTDANGKAGSVCSGKVILTSVVTVGDTLTLTMAGAAILWGPCPATITLTISLSNPTKADYSDSSGGTGSITVY
ncbi:S8 family serine peptidase [Epidermidibacterium keratini]|uniref:S8 family serine peptidase n=1 Tax=Epidermidibacterium keratini TaxID=1891644 RepID=A0A7L4YL84_9ACTN|nr:S8 family serine peptidase [Epidermidibacterium keratini]QHC00021.1 S8 family serine peptidase [Epidermidibacterium keratini]